MSADNARDAAQEWIASRGLPEDLRGRVVQIITFLSEEHCRFFYPRRALAWQQQVGTYISKGVRGRRSKVKRVVITPEDYQVWRGDREDTPALRREYAESFQRLLE